MVLTVFTDIFFRNDLDLWRPRDGSPNYITGLKNVDMTTG